MNENRYHHEINHSVPVRSLCGLVHKAVVDITRLSDPGAPSPAETNEVSYFSYMNHILESVIIVIFLLMFMYVVVVVVVDSDITVLFIFVFLPVVVYRLTDDFPLASTIGSAGVSAFFSCSSLGNIPLQRLSLPPTQPIYLPMSKRVRVRVLSMMT